MLVFHIDEATRAFRGRSSSVALPPSRRRARTRGVRASVPANAVVNAPPEPAAPGQQWVASHIDRSEPNFPRAIWRQVAQADAPQPSPMTAEAPDQPVRAADRAVSVEQMAVLALALMLTRGKAKALARAQALGLLRRWIAQHGGDAAGRLNAEIEALLREGFDARDHPDRA